jgi:hypothetical protein
MASAFLLEVYVAGIGRDTPILPDHNYAYIYTKFRLEGISYIRVNLVFLDGSSWPI